MQQILRQGEHAFINFFERLHLDITSGPEMQALLMYYRSGVELTGIIYRINGVTKDPIRCMDRLQVTPMYFVRPEFRSDPHFSFPPTQRVAHREIQRCVKNISILPWQETMTARAGSVYRDNADGYMAREVLSTRLELATFLD